MSLINSRKLIRNLMPVFACRFEFLMLGIQPVIDKLRKHENDTLNRY